MKTSQNKTFNRERFLQELDELQRAEYNYCLIAMKLDKVRKEPIDMPLPVWERNTDTGEWEYISPCPYWGQVLLVVHMYEVYDGRERPKKPPRYYHLYCYRWVNEKEGYEAFAGCKPHPDHHYIKPVCAYPAFDYKKHIKINLQ